MSDETRKKQLFCVREIESGTYDVFFENTIWLSYDNLALAEEAARSLSEAYNMGMRSNGDCYEYRDINRALCVWCDADIPSRKCDQGNGWYHEVDGSRHKCQASKWREANREVET